MNEELKKIKKLYGENFAHLCRSLFPTILDKPGTLLQILQSKFATNSRTLYDYIEANELEEDFKKFIFEQFNVKPKQVIKNDVYKTPYELMKEAGYTLVECTSEEEIQDFKKYYDTGEELCTFRGGRLKNCLIFWAVRDNAEDLKREDFKKPEREDEYGTSVMSIQFLREEKSIVSIKNRYNHKVNNPDATFGNDLDRIIPGLEQSFSELLQQRGLTFSDENKEHFEIPNYVVANDGKYYKYNIEKNGIYYCPGNIVIENGNVHEVGNQEQEILMDYFVLDLKNKKIKVYNNEEDSFIDGLQNIDKIDVKKDKENDTKIITIVQNGKNPVTIELDKDNQIIRYENSNLKKVGNYFLSGNRVLTQIKLPKLEQVGNEFLLYNETLTQLELKSLEKVGHDFLFNNRVLNYLMLPKLKKVGDDFLYYNQELEQLELPQLNQVGNDFVYKNKIIKLVQLQQLEQIGDHFMHSNLSLTELELPSAKQIGDSFLSNNVYLKRAEMPNVEEIGNYFLRNNRGLNELEMSNLKRGEEFLASKQLALLDKESQLTETEINKNLLIRLKQKSQSKER